MSRNKQLLRMRRRRSRRRTMGRSLSGWSVQVWFGLAYATREALVAMENVGT